MSTLNKNVVTANNVVVSIDGKQIGAVQSLSIQDNYALTGVYEIGNIDPLENPPTQATYSVSCKQVIINAKSLRSLGITPENSEVVLQGLVFDIEALSKEGVSLRKVRGCSYDSGTVTIDKNQVVITDAQFKALSISGQGA